MGAAAPLNSQDRIIFFDGVCNLCVGAIQFVIHRDRKQNFRFASLQSDFAKNKLRDFGIAGQINTIVAVINNRVFVKSDAALEIARYLNFPWSIFYSLKIFPRGLRDYVYDWIANHRYGWFGKKNACMIPDEKIAKRFIN